MTMKPSNVYILDGGLGSELEAQGFGAESDPLYGSSLLLHKPQAIYDVHKRFLECGSDVITTATYQASLKGMTQNLNISTEEANSLIHKAVQIAQNASDEFWRNKSSNSDRRKPLVAGSVGPYGAILLNSSEYHGQYVDSMDKEELKEWHRPRIQCLVDAGIDLLALETIPACKEAEALVELMKEYPSTKAWLSFSCKDANHTCHGEPFRDSIRQCLQLDSGHQLVAIGINCSKPNFISSLLRQAEGSTGNIPFVVYPNSGEEWTRERRWYGKAECVKVKSLIEDWLSLNVKYIGGCCRMLPADIQSIAKEVSRICAKSDLNA